MSKRAAITAMLIGLGWAIGRAQTAQPDFKLVVNSPVGESTVECVRGCALAWVERGVNPAAAPTPTFTFKCSGQERYSSYRIGGWLTTK